MNKVKVKLNGLYIGITIMSCEEIAKAEKAGFTIIKTAERNCLDKFCYSDII